MVRFFRVTQRLVTQNAFYHLAVFAALEGAIPYGHLKKYRFGHAHLPGTGNLPCLRTTVLARLSSLQDFVVMACLFFFAYCNAVMLSGHPELRGCPGVKFSSGRLGHMWPHVNGVAMANPDKISICRAFSLHFLWALHVP